MYLKVVDPAGNVLFATQDVPQIPAPGDTLAWDRDLVIRPGPTRWERMKVGHSMLVWVAVRVADVAKGK